MNLAALVSGGKDSVYGVYWALKSKHNVKYLITIIPEDKDSWLYHTPNLHLMSYISECIGIKLIKKSALGEKEKEIKDLENVLKKIRNEIDGVVCGAIASQYQYSRVTRICNELKLKVFAPLWQMGDEEVLKTELNAGLEIIIVGCYADGFDESWLGRKIDKKCFEDLKKIKEKFKINLAGDGGEYETLVTNAPIYKKRIVIKKLKKCWDDETGSGRLEVEDVDLVRK